MILENDERCTGCSACSHICPTQSIEIKYNEEGFLYPFIDKNKCIKCNKCESVCQIYKIKTYSKPEYCYAAWSKDEKNRLKSASGAIFYEIACAILNQHGLVCGAAFVDNFEVKHIIIDNYNDLHKLQGSKYIQSDLNDCFVRIKSYLDEGKKILFSGTGCQVAGLKKFLNKEYYNLITIDIVCHGVPSPGVFKDYLNELKNKIGDFDKITYRDKLNGWNWDYYFTVYRRNEIIFREPVGINIYLTAFLRDYILRRSCHICKFASISRCSDITLGDFWNIKKHRKDLDDGKGISLILIHSHLGENIIESIKDRLECLEKLDIKLALQSNANLVRPSPAHANRRKFFDDYAKNKCVTNWFDKEFNTIGILNFHFASNIGAVMVAYSLTKVLNNMGYSSEIINYRPSGKIEKDKYEEFRIKYIPQSRIYSSVQELNKSKYRRIIVGSDQVWKLGNTEMFMLSWATGYRSFIAYAASFGDSKYTGNVSKEYAKILLKRFDSISVRENSGVNICNSLFNVHAEHVLDPTFLLPAADYEKIISEDKDIFKINKQYIFISCYSNENNRILNHENVVQMEFSDFQIIDFWKLNKPSVAQILYLIKNATYIITDSFHMTVFSIIFNKEFISLVPKNFNGQDRIPSLLYNLELKKRILENLSFVKKNNFKEKIDYIKVNKLIYRKKISSLKFIKNSLKKNILFKDSVYETNYEIIETNFWKHFIEKYKNELPYFLNTMTTFDQNYFLFFIEGCPGSIHYEIVRPVNKFMKIALHFEDKETILDKIKIEKIKILSKKLAIFGFEYIQTETSLGMRKNININNFISEFNILVENSYFDIIAIMKNKPIREFYFPALLKMSNLIAIDKINN